MTIKKSLLLFFAWCKKNIKFIFGFLLALVLMLLFRRDKMSQLRDLFQKEDDLYRQRKEVLENQHREEIERNRRYAEVEEELRRQGSAEAGKLRSKHKEIIEQNKDKTPEELARLISEQTGWDIN